MKVILKKRIQFWLIGILVCTAVVAIAQDRSDDIADKQWDADMFKPPKSLAAEAGVSGINSSSAIHPSTHVNWNTKPHMQRVGPNLIPNSDFNGISTYVLSNGAVYDSTVTRTAGSGSVKFSGEGERMEPLHMIPVTPGNIYTLSTYTLSAPTGGGPLPVLGMWYSYFDANGDEINTPFDSGRSGNSMAGVWEETTRFIVVPEMLLNREPTQLAVWFSMYDDVEEVSRTAWVDDVYLGLGRGFEQPASPKTAFNGKKTKVDELGNIEVLKNGAWESFFPLAIYGDGNRPDWSDYSNQGFNMEMRAKSDIAYQKATDAGMMLGLEVTPFMKEIVGYISWYNNPLYLQQRITALKQQSEYWDAVVLYYWDNEHAWDEWSAPQAITGAIKQVDIDNNGDRLHPLYSLNGNTGVARRHLSNQAQISDITGTYVGIGLGAPALGVTDNLRILDNTENQRQPAVFAQFNIGVGNELRARLLGAIAHGARGMGFWRDRYNYTNGSPSVDELPWWDDFPAIAADIDQMMDAGLIQVPHWTEWSLSTNNDDIDFGTRHLNGVGYLIAANYNDSTLTTTFSLNGLGYTPIEVRDFFTDVVVTTVTSNQFIVTLPANTGGVYRLVAEEPIFANGFE